MPLHTQAGDTTAVATFPLSLISTRPLREPPREATEPHPFPLDGRRPDTGLGITGEAGYAVSGRWRNQSAKLSQNAVRGRANHRRRNEM